MTYSQLIYTELKDGDFPVRYLNSISFIALQRICPRAPLPQSSLNWLVFTGQITGQSHDLHGKIGLVSGESIFPKSSTHWASCLYSSNEPPPIHHHFYGWDSNHQTLVITGLGGFRPWWIAAPLTGTPSGQLMPWWRWLNASWDRLTDGSAGLPPEFLGENHGKTMGKWWFHGIYMGF